MTGVCTVYITNSLAVLSRMVRGEEGGLSPEAENPVRSLFSGC